MDKERSSYGCYHYWDKWRLEKRNMIWINLLFGERHNVIVRYQVRVCKKCGLIEEIRMKD